MKTPTIFAIFVISLVLPILAYVALAPNYARYHAADIIIDQIL